MPGLSLIYKIDHLDSSLISDSLADLKHEQNYEVRKIYETRNFISVFSGYEGYPSQCFEDDNAVYLVEGLIYNKDDSEIVNLLKAISKVYIAGNDYEVLIKEFIDNSDGDFNVLTYFKKIDEFIIFNDRWGRLPSYFYHDDDMFVFSRELKFILNFIPSIEFDKTAIAEFLVFQYVLGDRTLFRNIYRLNPSCLFNLKQYDSKFRIKMEQVLDINFEQSARTLSERECVEKCRDLFVQGISNRVKRVQEKKYNITADLTGGYDTRAVFAGLSKLNVKVDFYTDPIRDYESEYVDKIAALYDIKPTMMGTLPGINFSDMSKVTFMTDCTVDAQTALSRYQASLERAKLVRDVSVRFMGLEGESLRTVYKSVKGSESITDMIKDGHFLSCIPIKQACSILNLDEEYFYDHLTEYFSKYPEPTLRDKVKHLYFDFTTHWDIAGEDRHRLHFWTVPPFWAKDLFDFALKCIPSAYIGSDFSRKFIRAIDPDVLKVPLYIYHVNLKSKVSLYRAALIRYLRIHLKKILVGHKNLFRFSTRIDRYLIRRKDKSEAERSDSFEKAKQELLESYANLKVLSTFFNKKGILELMNEYSETNLYQLLTAILYFKEIENRYGHKIYNVSC